MEHYNKELAPYQKGTARNSNKLETDARRITRVTARRVSLHNVNKKTTNTAKIEIPPIGNAAPSSRRVSNEQISNHRAKYECTTTIQNAFYRQPRQHNFLCQKKIIDLTFNNPKVVSQTAISKLHLYPNDNRVVSALAVELTLKS